jgi:3-hydroxyisobutyrate dehydrogenase
MTDTSSPRGSSAPAPGKATFAPGTVWAQRGTIGVAPTTTVSARLGQVRPDALFLDAPVSGSKGPAQTGQLLILASGPAAAIEGGPLDAPIADATGQAILAGPERR